MNITAKWDNEVSFIGETGSGHRITMDGNEVKGARPMELLLLGLAGCTLFDVVQMLKKSRQAISDCSVHIDSRRSDTVPKVFTHIHIHYQISGKDIKEPQVKRAIELSKSKYCSASIMLGKTAAISHDYQIIENG